MAEGYNITEEESLKLPDISEDLVRKQVVKKARKHLLYSKKAAKHLDLTGIEQTRHYQYNLDTYVENRKTGPAYEPYIGQPIDTKDNGIPPDPRNITVNPSEEFRDDEESVEIPHTAYVETCPCCSRGRLRCDSCSGKGDIICDTCDGDGKNPDYTRQPDSMYVGEKEKCKICKGNKRITCSCCKGDGTCTCGKCDGAGKLKHYTKLTVTWRNIPDEVIVGKWSKDLTEKRIKYAGRKTICQEIKATVEPLQQFTHHEIIKSTSSRVIQTRQQIDPRGKILKQRQTLYMIPVTRCTYQWKGTERYLYLYGTDHYVYAPKFPQNCNCTCEIL